MKRKNVWITISAVDNIDSRSKIEAISKVSLNKSDTPWLHIYDIVCFIEGRKLLKFLKKHTYTYKPKNQRSWSFHYDEAVLLIKEINNLIENKPNKIKGDFKFQAVALAKKLQERLDTGYTWFKGHYNI